MDRYSLIQNIWIILLLWSFIYLGDYFLTIYSAKKFREQLADHYEFERSFELNPTFENDVNSLRLISPRHIIFWVLTSFLFYLLWWITNLSNIRQLFYFIFGALFLLEIAIHLRHLRNIAIIKSYAEGAIFGQIKYSYWFGLKLSAWELFGFFIFYGFIAFVESSWFFVGGSLGCLILSIKHCKDSNKARKLSIEADPKLKDA